MTITYCDDLGIVVEIVDEHGITMVYEPNDDTHYMVFNDKRINVLYVTNIQAI